ncbi:MAG: Flp pilus assembly protein CpaB [Planctomycetota bacterium]|nr:MAG: Flp pilus assembly protein CpaB [Planctomycetota bacterium]
MNSKFALIIAIILGAFSAIAIKNYINNIEKKVAAPKKQQSFLVAKMTLKPGQRIKASDLDVHEMPREFFDRKNMMTREDSTAVIGQTIYYEVKKGSIILRAHFKPAGTGVGSGSIIKRKSGVISLGPGERAISLKVDGLTGVAMLLKPSEFVDIYWTGGADAESAKLLGLKPSSSGGGSDKVSFLLLSDVQVLALDNRTHLTPRQFGNRIVQPKANYSSITVRCRSYEEAKLLIQAQVSGRLTMAKKGNDHNVVDDDTALNVPKMIMLSRKANNIRSKH